MPNNPAKCEVLIKQYLRSILDISADWLLQLTRNLEVWSQDFSFDEKRWQFISNCKATWTQWPEDWWIQQWYFPHLGTRKKTPIVNQSWIENMISTRSYYPTHFSPVHFAMVLPLKRSANLELVAPVEIYVEPRNKHRYPHDWRYPPPARTKRSQKWIYFTSGIRN